MMLQGNLILTSILFVLLVADGVLTIRTLEHGGRELNPVLSFMIREFGLGPAIVASRGFALGLIVIFCIAKQTTFLVGLLVPTVVFVACGAYSLVRSEEMIPSLTHG
jgi:hypothetical protein